MYWVVQRDLHPEAGLTALRQVLERYDLPWSLHTVVPGAQRLEPEVEPRGPVLVIGGYTLSRIAVARGWTPGAFPVPDLAELLARWGGHLLNARALQITLGAVPERPGPFFARPLHDSKAFTGRTFSSWEEFEGWRRGRDPALAVLVAPIAAILRESRLWVVDGRVVTASVYREGQQIRYDPLVSEDVLTFGRERAAEFAPARAYVLDIAETPDGLRVIEVNNLNAAGFYAANVGRLVEALEGMGY